MDELNFKSDRFYNNNSYDKTVMKNGTDFKLVYFEETDSTNEQAKLLVNNGYDKPVVLIADRQTAGKGRMGRSFYSPEGTGLYMSYLFKPKMSVADAVAVTSATAVAVVRSIKELTDKQPLIKWVNDIYIEGKKVCGILAESVTDKNGELFVIVGIGINIITSDFPEDIKDIAGALGVCIERERLAIAVIKHLRELIDELPNKTFLEDYRKYSAVIGKKVIYKTQGESRLATAVGIDGNGGLIVEAENGERTTLSTGEITLRLDDV